MANNSPTIVAASLSDDQLKKSIDSLVTHVDEAMKKMVQSTNNAVGEMEAKLKSLGNLKIDSGGSNDGGTGRRTQQHEKLTKAVNDASEAVTKETQKLQDLQQSLSGASDREQNFISQKERAANTIAQENELLSKQQSELERLKLQKQSLLKTEGVSTKPNDETSKRIERLNQQLEEAKTRLQGLKSLSVISIDSGTRRDFTEGIIAEAKRLKSTLDMSKMSLEEMLKLPSTGNEKLDKHIESVRRLMGAWNSEPIKLAEERIISIKREIDSLTSKKGAERTDTNNSQRIAQIDAQVAAKEKEIAETKGRIAAATREQSEADKNASQAAREKSNIQSQVANQEKQVAEAKKQLTTATQQHADAETKSSRATKEKTMTLDQQASAINTAIQSEKKYTDEIRNQAAAIRATKEWQEKGHVVVGDVNYYDKERANVSKRDKQLLLSLEEQIVQAQQKEAQEALVAAEAKRQQAQAAKEAAQASKGVSAYDLGIDPNVSAGRQRQIESTRKASKETEYLRQQVASLLEVEEKEVKSVNMTTASYSELSQHLKQLQSAYSKLGADRIKKGEGVDIANEIQRTQRAMQKLQQTMSRPISLKDAMGLSEKSLDDIAYKMRQLASYRSGLNVETQTKEINQVNAKYAELQKKMNDLIGKNNDMIASNTALGRSWNYMKNRLAFYFTVGASTAFVKNLIEVRSQYEMNERALGILIDSAERGTQIFNELSQMALVSPYTLIELSTAAKQLTAYDIAAKDVVDTTRRLADMAAAVGIPIERLTYALGQIKAYGYLNARDARMFSNAGIPLVKQLAEYYTELEGKMVSTADVYDRIKKKAIDMTDVMQVINKMTDEGGKFFDFQAKMAGTLKVQLANLTLAWNNMLNDIGASEQGTISTGIGLLKELFLEWKNISKMVTNLAIGFGVVKAAQLAYYGVVMGTNKAIALETVLGNRLSNNLRSLTSSMNAARMSSTALWVGIATVAAAAVVDILRGNEAMKEFNKTLRENAENTYNDLKKFSENYSGLRESLYKTENGKQTPVDINNEEAKKAWEVLREQIELSSHASDEYIGKLLSIENVSERLRQGFAMIESIQSVSAAIKELGDSAIKLERDWSEWWNLGLLPDGTIGNLQDAYMWLSKIEEKYGSIVNARKVASTSRTDEGLDNVFQDEAKEFVENYETELEKFRKDLQVTKQSIIDFIELKGWSGDTSKINEVFKTFTDNLILKNQLNPQQAYTLQLEMEEARSKAAKQALLQRINDEKAAYKISHDESVRQALNADIKRYNSWSETNGRSKVEWERFTKWLKEQHISETTEMFRNMDAEDIRSLNFQEGKHAEWVKRMVTQYAKEHKMSYDDAFGYLKSWVTSANQWSIRIPVMLDIQNLSWLQEDFKNRLPESTLDVSQYKTLSAAISDWQKKRKEGLEEIQRLEKAGIYLTTGGTEADREHYAEVQKEVSDATDALKAYKAELTKGSGGKKKDPVLDALKLEASLVEKLQGEYDKLTKSGASQSDALETIRGAYGKTIRLLNAQLGKYGLPQLDISQLITGKDPNKALAYFKQTLDTLVSKGMLTLERSKELEAVVEKFTLSAKTYNLDMITKGLNNELGKLKDEYELAVELDANPELGDMFADMFGINTSTLPKTFGDALDKAQTIINRKLTEMNITTPFDLMEGNIDSFAKSTGLDKDGAVIKELVSAQNAYRDMFKKNITETEKMLDDYIKKYGDYSDKIAEIEAGRLEKLKKLNEAYYTEEMRKRPEYTAKLNAIEQGASKEKQQVDFDEFKNSRYYTMMFENLDYISTKTIRDMRGRVRELIDTMNDLTPEQLKTIMSQYEKLEQKLVKRSPFKTLTKDLKEYFSTSKERKSANQEFKNAQKEYDAQKKNVAALKEKYEQAKANSNTSKSYLDFLQIEISGENEILQILKQQLDAAQKKADKYNLTAKLAKSEALQVAQVVGQNLQSLGELRDFLRQDLGVELSDELNGLVDGLSKVGQGINKITSSATSGDIVGVITGVGQTIYGIYDGIASIFGGGSTSDKKITKQIQDSERAVKQLELAYKNLEFAIENAYGANVVGANQAAIANKELQLAELNRQLALEKSRDSKKRDDDRIMELQGQIIDLQNDIKRSMQEVTTELLGISSVGDAALSFMDAYISALRKGEDAQKAFTGSWKEMIANMIKQLWVTKVIGPQLEALVDDMNKRISERSKKETEAYRNAVDKKTRLSTMDGKEILSEMTGLNIDLITWDAVEQYKDAIDAYVSSANADVEKTKKELDKATIPTIEDMDMVAQSGKDLLPLLQASDEQLNELLKKYGLYEDQSDKTLSALQQGIQGITEDTAGALEAYMNGVSQQVYLHSDLLTQIRDAVVGIDIDVQVATQAQMLLQLQQSYAVQMAIQGILEGVLNPSGRAFSVELVS